MTIQQAAKLELYDKIDHQDSTNRFLQAPIIDKRGSRLKIHYNGWHKKWDTWHHYRQEIHRSAKAGSISRRPALRFKDLKYEDKVDVLWNDGQ